VNMSSNKFGYVYKILLLGPPMVGKTSLMYRYVNNFFNENYIATLGAQFLSKEIKIKSGKRKDEIIKLIIWDIMGQSNPAFEDLRTTFYRGSDGAILMFDLTRKDSLDRLSEWYSQVMKILGKDVPVLLIGNKKDLIEASKNQEIRKQANLFAKSIESHYLETSAKTGENVNTAFAKLAFKLAKNAGYDISDEKIIQESPTNAERLDFIVKSRIKDYIRGKGFRSSKSIFKSSILNERIRELLDKAVCRAIENDRKTVKPRDL
ncbi:MAG: GTP-binding protein, partial [Promethearchaeota archaeon]